MATTPDPTLAAGLAAGPDTALAAELVGAELYLSRPAGQPLPDAAALRAALARCGLRARHAEVVNLLQHPQRARAAGVSVTPCWRLVQAQGAFLVHGVGEELDRSAVDAAQQRAPSAGTA